MAKNNFRSSIVVGSLRFAINAFSRDEKHNMKTASKLLQLLISLFYQSNTQKNKISEFSLFFSPKVITACAYRGKYQQLIDANREVAHRETPLTLLAHWADYWTVHIYEEGRYIKEDTDYYDRKMEN